MGSVKKPKRTRLRHYFKEWRKFRKIGQSKAIELLGWSPSKISRIETGQTPYNQDDLEIAAEIFECEPASILTVNPLEDNIDAVMFDEQLVYDVVETLFDTYPPESFRKHSPKDMAELIVMCAKTELAHPSQPDVMSTMIELTGKNPKTD
jgi:transcriptional regulator with XRE-family HTH domain